MKHNSKFAAGDLKKREHYLAVLFIVLVLFSIFSLDVWAKIPVLRVGIFLDYKEVAVKSEKGLRIYEIPSMKNLFIQENNHPLKIIANPRGIEINNQLYDSIGEIKIIPGDGGFIQVEDRKYRGEIEIISNQTLINVINVIEIEKYLYGVLKKEISPEWPEEVLKAQAIAARTFALSNMGKYIDQGYNICATTNSQAYGGIFHEHPATNKAVNDTRGVIATYDGEPINAVYHSDSGGHTENSEDVWGGHIPYLRSVPSDYEEIVSSPNHKWEYSLTEQEVLAKLAQQGFQLSRIDNIIISERTETGRAKSVEIIGDNNQIINLKTNDFRLLIGPTLIRSSLFTIDKTGGEREEISLDDNHIEAPEQAAQPPKKSVSDLLKEETNFSISELIALLNRPKDERKPEKKTLPIVKEKIQSSELLFFFSGQGNGHGVGLSQWGAHGMASEGFAYEDILKYYYQGIQFKKIY